MVVAKKNNNSLRICVNYKELNGKVVRERVILPTAEENLAKLFGAKVLSKLEAKAGYWHVPLLPDSQELTTFITPMGCVLRRRFRGTEVLIPFMRTCGITKYRVPQ